MVIASLHCLSEMTCRKSVKSISSQLREIEAKHPHKRDHLVWKRTPELSPLLWVCSFEKTHIPNDIMKTVLEYLGTTCQHIGAEERTDTVNDMWRLTLHCSACESTKIVSEGPFFC